MHETRIPSIRFSKNNDPEKLIRDRLTTEETIWFGEFGERTIFEARNTTDEGFLVFCQCSVSHGSASTTSSNAGKVSSSISRFHCSRNPSKDFNGFRGSFSADSVQKMIPSTGDLLFLQASALIVEKLCFASSLCTSDPNGESDTTITVDILLVRWDLISFTIHTKNVYSRSTGIKAVVYGE